MTISSVVQSLSELLKQEQAPGVVQGLDEIQAHQQRRRMINGQFQQLEEEVRRLRTQIRNLPALPPLKIVQWAQSVRAMPNVVFLEVDTTGLHEQAEIIRLVVLNIQGQVLLDCLVKPSQPLSQTITMFSGLTNDDMKGSKTSIVDALTRLRQVVKGAYVLSYNMDFDLGKLKEASHRHHLSEITIIGEDLMTQAMGYFHQTAYPKLEVLCKQIGQPLPLQPCQTALDRAKGQIALLNAIADAVPVQIDHTISRKESFDEVMDDYPV
ncbi:hypothetical protein KDA_19180 [Dictyobacter alpinus]|uniref:Exonuclease domain-containing protein n=1 Tax=Dictyobacter alpinus TaxID=2014873 RepID=A0A402B513_9CHLR|nr:exonuclease domain-containing protein [Dictyobacter alpinus]GCE26434.1 hypothetical protein KDA_19180 [Dictyobacter alpinus]